MEFRDLKIPTAITMNSTGQVSIQVLLIALAILITSIVAVELIIRGPLTRTRGEERTASQSSVDSAGGTGFKVLEVYTEPKTPGTDAVDYWYVRFKLTPASTWVNAGEVLVQLEASNESYSQVYNRSINCSIRNESDASSTYATQNLGYFGVEHLIERTSDSGIDASVISNRDLVLFCFRTPRSILHDEHFVLTLVPKRGIPYVIDQTMPQSLNEGRITLFQRQ